MKNGHQITQACLAAIAGSSFAFSALGQCTGWDSSRLYTGQTGNTMIGYSFATGDIDGDGYTDVVWTGRYGDLVLFMNGGNGSFFARPTIAAATGLGSEQTIGTLVVDMNNHGYSDIVVRSGHYIAILRALSPGVFASTLVSFPFAYGGASHDPMWAVDFNGDGKHEILTWGSANPVIISSNADGTLAFNEIPVVGGTLDAVPGDFNHDGKPDIAVLTASGLQILINAGGGSFQPGQFLPLTITSAHSLKVADLNGDGVPDLAYLDSTNSGVQTLIGDGHGIFHVGTFYPCANPAQLYLVDVDGDGDADILTVPTGQSAFSVYFNGGGDAFQNLPVTHPGEQDPSLYFQNAVADVTNDGLPDIIVDATTTDVAGGSGQAGIRVFPSIKSSIISQPQSVTLSDSQTYASFTVAMSDFGGPYSYRWQMQSASSGPWTDVPGGPMDGIGIFEGQNEATLQVENIQSGCAGLSFRVIVAGDCRQYKSAQATLTVSGPTCAADFNHDGFVDFFDFNDFIDAFETGC